MEPWRILIVEDYEPARQGFVELLRDCFPSAAVHSAPDRNDARRLWLEAHRAHLPYDLAIVDLRLPEKLSGTVEEYEATFDGEFFRQFWVNHYETPVIVMTAFETHEEVTACFKGLEMFADRLVRTHVKRTGYSYEIIKDCRDILFGESILRQLRGLFRRERNGEKVGIGPRLYHDFTRRADRTSLLNSVRTNILENWRHLKPDTRAEVQQFISVKPGATTGTPGDIDLLLVDEKTVKQFMRKCGHPDQRIPGISLYWLPRDPESGAGNGRNGTCPPALLEGYRKGLARASESLSKCRPKFSGNLDVFVMDLTELHLRWDNCKNMLIGCPFSLVSSRRMFLPSRSAETSAELAMGRATVEAAHETVHFYNQVGAAESQWWEAFDEATCFYYERMLFPENPWTITSSIEWIDRPEESWKTLHGTGGWLFLQFLDSVWGEHSVEKVWQSQGEADRIRWEVVMAEAFGQTVGALFSSFLPEAYFAERMCPGIGELYAATRALHLTLSLGESNPRLEDSHTIGLFGCAYYRICLPNSGKVAITLPNEGKLHGIAAKLIFCDANGRPGESGEFAQIGKTLLATIHSQLEREVSNGAWILCVSNSPLAWSANCNEIKYSVTFEWSA